MYQIHQDTKFFKIANNFIAVLSDLIFLFPNTSQHHLSETDKIDFSTTIITVKS